MSGDSQHGRIITRKGNRLIVKPDGSKVTVRCAQRKKLPPLAIGDEVIWESTSKGEGVITELDPRSSLLSRPDPFNHRKKPIAANIDQILIVTAPEPGIDPLQIDRILVAATASQIDALLVINKVDLLSPKQREDLHQQLTPYEKLSIPLLWGSTTVTDGLIEIERQLEGKSSVLVGPSGAGKSSIIQALLPHEEIATGTLSAASGQGRLTTSVSTLYPLTCGGNLVDSPGIREFGLWDLDEETIRNGFGEFDEFSGQCRFSNCRHLSEPGCAITAAVEHGEISADRLLHYRTLIEALAES